MTGSREAASRVAPRRPGVEKFLEIYRDARLLPYSPADSACMRALEGCLNCGNCLAACPVLGSSAEHPYPGPRTVGTSLSRSVPDYWSAAEIAGFCTTCMACEEACPGDVPVHRAVLMLRAKNFEQRTREGKDPLTRGKRFLVDFFAQNRLAQAVRWGAALQGLAFRKTATGEMKARVPLPIGPLGSRVVPPLARRSLAEEFPAPVPGNDPDGPRVAVFAGCLMNYAYTDTGRNLVKVLARHSREVIVPAGQVCCGAPVLYSGDFATSRRLAAENAAAFAAMDADLIVTACASCGDVMTREYPALVTEATTPVPGSEGAPASAAEAHAATAATAVESGAVLEFSEKVRDIHAFLTDDVKFRPPEPSGSGRASGSGRPSGSVSGPGSSRIVTVHDPCHLVRGQGLAREVRDLLRAVPGVTLTEMAEPAACCGGAGSFSLDHYELADAIRRRKVADIEATGAATVVTGCPSCRMHIAEGLEKAGKGRPVRHLVDLLAEAYGDSGD